MGGAFLVGFYFLALAVFMLAGWIKSPHQALVVSLIFLAVVVAWGWLSEMSC